eukprot:UN00703
MPGIYAGRKKRVPGQTLMSKMYPHPQCHASKLRKLGYVPPNWHRALRKAPPKDIYPLRKLKKCTLPGDIVVRQVFKKIPMLRKEKYEFYNQDYQPLAVRIALTQMRLQREEGLTEDEAFKKAEREIFKGELYYFAKGIRDSKGNHFKLTTDEMRAFYIHDLINEAHFLKNKVQKLVDENPVSSVAANSEDHKKAAVDILSKYFAQEEPTLEQAKIQAGYVQPVVDILHTPYKKSGIYPNYQLSTTTGHEDYNPDDAMLFRHGATHQENQRYIQSQVQVPASAFLDALDFADERRGPPEYKMPVSWDNDSMFNPTALLTPGHTHHYGLDVPNFFTAHEGLTYRELNNKEQEMDFEIAQMLLQNDAIEKEVKENTEKH